MDSNKLIQTIITDSPLISSVVQTLIIFGVLYAIFLIAKKSLSKEEGKEQVWTSLGAIIILLSLYSFLFL